jgi:hypothetical protein
MNLQTLKNLTDQPITIVQWCSFCAAEPGHGTVAVELNGDPMDLPIGLNCLAKAEEAGKISEEVDTPSNN